MKVPVKVICIDTLTSFFSIALLAQILYFIQFNYHSKSPINAVNLAIVSCFTAFSLLIFLSCTSIAQRMGDWIPNQDQSIWLRIAILFLLFMLINFYWWIQKNERMQLKIQQHMMDSERLILNAELAAVHDQFQPHFLFNSLNSISALTLSEPKMANEMIHLLSDYLRGTLRQDMQQKVPLLQEIEQINRYLAIEKVRFGDRLSIIITHTEDSLNATIPLFILQPIVENAIKYGIYGQLEELTISIDFSLVSNQLLVGVVNPFDELNRDSMRGKGVGLSTIRKRMNLLYGRNDVLKTTELNGIFQIELTVPQ